MTRQAAGGRPAAEFEAFFAATAPQVRRYAHRMVDRASVDDIVAETFTVVWQRWVDVPADPDRRRAWAFRVAHHRVQHWYEAKQREVRLHRRLGPARADVADHAADIVGEHDVAAVLALLPPAEREAMWLVVSVGLSPKDAAFVLDCAPSAVTTRLSRARQRLATVLAARVEGEVAR
ncbi:RNA polymerase sigma factor [Cellulomonas sp. PhB150]|uniref:RNA polymerase sigma factor n=1 Tax=Cellulomonas sp. PhB150 TaxID=2485188 RepID=UPI000F4A9F7B|nr:sigma-70 family RNA polymerase sigma factor [Cellulomonas sp. PhB150]ROS23678.1 RNA polymerase sigma-70 factor (ECF subfamily) [Cellulomonas sp. PhB150]